ncbi:hypothetical protein SDC9_196022 [bioreactor metagenome]|uniref:Uncharacterized protein n=1 Tax=bioreactor metagenome TaxID=1076179 RepID=A0A645IAX9_9ZZZZ
MLVYHTDAQIDRIRGPFDLYTLPAEENFAFVRLMNAVEDVHQRRFPRAVFAEEGDDLPLPERKVDMIYRFRPWKGLTDVLHCNNLHVGSFQCKRRRL